MADFKVPHITARSANLRRPLLLLTSILLLGPSPSTLHAQPTVGGCPMFPANNIWNVPIDNLPVDANSDLYINTIGASKPLHPDFSSGGGGIPFMIVPATQPKVKVDFGGNEESDPGPYPVPPKPTIEPSSDAHLLIVQQGSCFLYEIFALSQKPDGTWSGGSGAIWYLNSNALRPASWTSADAAGLPILAGLVRYDEVASGEIHHAIRMTAPQTQRKFVWPARHYASSLTAPQYPPMGQRFRLKASFDISGYPPDAQVVLKALKKYGAMLSDNGSSWFLTGAPDTRWNDDTLHTLSKVVGANMEAVDVTSLIISQDSALASATTSSPARYNVPWSPTPTFDPSLGATQSITLAGDVASSTLVNLADGLQVNFLICQDPAGGHAFVWPENVRGGMDIGQSPGKCSAQSFISDGVNLFATSPGRTDI